jgi:hypothetical protein
VVFLDELTSGLDRGARHATWDLISQVRAQGVTVVLKSLPGQIGTQYIASIGVAIVLAILGLNGVPMVIGQYRERGILRRAGLLEPGGRRPPVHQRGHGQDPRAAHLRQARRQRPRRRGGGRVRARPAAPRLI